MDYIQANWPAPSHIKAYCTRRDKGQSLGPYTSFNLALHVGDDAGSVLLNREKLKKDLNLPTEALWLNQVHGTNVVNLNDNYVHENREAIKADASLSFEKNLVCAVLTADCLPLLICDKKGSFVAAVHAGWRGLCSGIIEQTLSYWKKPPQDLLVWLGPAIGAKEFEVGVDVYNAFKADNLNNLKGFKQQALNPKKYLMDIYEIARIKLKKYGVENIYGGEYCTFTNAQDFYSYRRDGVTGRMASLIWIT
ncbi:MAG: yfiH [Francisellaceae bacterium]|nr:yfiH [Francisellaceae bacterium]